MKLLQRSFAAGEITEELSGQIESREYQTGLKRCRNFITLPHGPAMLRPGFMHEQYAFGVEHAARLIPFVPDQDSSFLVCIVEGKAFVLSGDGLGTVTGESAASAAIMHSGDPNQFKLRVATGGTQPTGFIYIRPNVGADANNLDAISGHWFKATFDNTAFGFNYYTLTHPVRGDVNISWQIPGGDPMTFDSSAGFDNAVELDLPYTAADLPNIHYAQSYDVLTLVCPGHPPQTIRYSSITGWTVTEEQIASYVVPVQSVVTPMAGSGGTTPTQQVFMAWLFVRSNGEWFPMDRSLFFTTSVDPVDGSITFGCSGALTADHRVVLYRLENGIFYSCAVRTGPGAATAAVALEPLNHDDPAPGNRIHFGVNDFRAVGYFEQRKLYGGVSVGDGGGPQTLIATRPGTEQDVSRHTPTEPNDAMDLTIASLRRNQIEHLVPLSSLLVLTTGGIFTLSGGAEGLATDSFHLETKSYHGANGAVPAVSGDAVFYGAARGGHVFIVRYSFEQGGFIVVDGSALAPHLFEGRTVRSMAVQESPYKILWVVLDDYTLLSLTFDFDLKVLAWHKHVTEGEVHYVTTLPNTVEDTVYLTVKRPTPTYPASAFMIEKMGPILDDDRTTAVRLDRAHVYSGVPADELTGLDALEGSIVRVVGDGGDMGEFEVVRGAITLPAEVSHANIGMPYQGQLETLPLAFEARGIGAYGQGRRKNINSVWLRLINSGSVWVGQNDTDLREVQPILPEELGDLPQLRTGLIEVGVDPEWRDDTTVHLLASDPFPVKVLSMAFDMEVSD